MNSNKIIVDFGRIENIVIARVVNTPNGIIGKGTIERGGEFSLRSFKFCDLCENILYLHGEEDYGKPSRFICYQYDTIEEAEKAINAYSYLITRFNSNYEGDNPIENLNIELERVE